jgi:hypothetical protein
MNEVSCVNTWKGREGGRGRRPPPARAGGTYAPTARDARGLTLTMQLGG